ncbi:MAG: radical SAM protein [Thermodesulfobacteriota bacterium]
MSYINKLKALWGLEDISGAVHGLVSNPKKLMNLAKFFFERPFNPIAPHYYPLTLMVEVSTACNLRCPTCERELFKHKGLVPKQQVSIENVERLRPILPYVYSVYFVGGLGEPFLNPAFWDMHRIIKGYKVKTGYFSNAAMWDDDIMEKTIREGVNSVLVSIDSHIPEKYDEIKLGAHFNQVIANVKRLGEIRKKFPAADFKLGLNYIQRSDTYEDMPEFLNFARGLGADFIIFTALIVHEEKFADKSPYLVDVGKRAKVYAEVRRKAAEYGMTIRLPELVMSDVYDKTCNSAWRCLSVFENGEVCLCPYFRSEREFYFHADGRSIKRYARVMNDTSVGNIYKENILDIWNSSKAQEMRRSIRSGKGVPNPCDTCYFRYNLH